MQHRPATPSPSELLQQAVAHHQRGQLAQAETLYREVLAAVPTNFDVLHLLGVVQYQNGRHEAAVELIQRALQSDPRQAAAYSNLGLALQGLRRWEEAVASYDRALALKPDYAEALNNRGNALLELKRSEEALGSYDEALALNPDDPIALNNRGKVLHRLNRYEEALVSYDRALLVKPDYAEALKNAGNALQALKRHEEALVSYDRALGLEPDDAMVLNNRGNALRDLKRFEEALASYGRALMLKPDYPEALLTSGNVLQELYRPGEALANYDRALEIRLDYGEAFNNRGNALQQLGRYQEALASYSSALALNPQHASAHYNESLCRLLMGDFENGWRKYEWRWRDEQLDTVKRDFRQPLWLGENPLAGKTVLLHAEQGVGDIVQFCRYAKMVSEQGAAVLLGVPLALESLLATLDGVSRLLVRDEPSSREFDYHCPLLSLPLAFNTRPDRVPAEVPYLYSDPVRVSKWRGKVSGRTLPRVGLMWSGSVTHKNDRHRSIPLAEFATILSAKAQFVSLQKELRPGDNVILNQRQIQHFGDELDDFADTAALIELMDLVITVDTSIAHLAGAMGKPVWILLPFHPDWRWLLEREDSPWYPTARLFRQPVIGDWSSVLQRIVNELR